MEITVLIPCLNEAKTIGKCVKDATLALESLRVQGEVLVADNGSTDGSPQLAEQAGARVVAVEEKGYGAALMGGISEAKGKFIIMGDGDDSYDFLKISAFVDHLRGGSELVIGNRFRGGIQKGAMPRLHRYIGNPILSAIGRIFFQIPIGDFHCGIRAFEAQAIRGLHLQSSGMEFATEMIAKAAFANLKISEVPTTLKPDGRGRPPHLRTWRDGWRHLRFMMLFSPKWLFLWPGALIMLIGILGLAALRTESVMVGSIGFDVHTMLFCSAATVMGFQAFQWGWLLEWMAIEANMKPEKNGIKLWLSRKITLEYALLVGLLLLILGIVWAWGLLSMWAEKEFGAIENSNMMREVILANTIMLVGLQSIGGALSGSAVSALLRSGFKQVRDNSVKCNDSEPKTIRAE